MERFVKDFWKEEEGNTTIDWMALTAGLVMLGAAVMASVTGSTRDLADHTNEVVDQIEPETGV